MHRILADLSRALNRASGGISGHTLCRRIALRYGYDCMFCRLIGKILRQPTHCLEELDAREIVDLARRQK